MGDTINADDVFYDDGGVGELANTQDAIDNLAYGYQSLLYLVEDVNDALSSI